MGKANKIDAYVMYSGNSQHIRVKIQNIGKANLIKGQHTAVRTEGYTHSPVINARRKSHASGSKQPIGIRIQMRPPGRAAKMSLTCQCQSDRNTRLKKNGIEFAINKEPQVAE